MSTEHSRSSEVQLENPAGNKAPTQAQPSDAAGEAADAATSTEITGAERAGWEKPRVRLRDPRSLRALAHPLRVALLGALRAYGPLTATQAAVYVDDSPSNCSFHLRTLGSFGLIEQVPGKDSRQRPWQVVEGPISYEPDERAESRDAGLAAADVMHNYVLEQYRVWSARADDAPEEWQDAAFDSNVTTSLTAAELAEIGRQFSTILSPYVQRRRARQAAGEPTPANELPVRLYVTGFPASAPTHTPAQQGHKAPRRKS